MANFRTQVTLERPGDPSIFGERTRADVQAIIARYPAGQERSALLPMLHLVQSEEGCITPDGIAFCAEQLNITRAQVSAVATFYTMYKRNPTGEYLVSVCTNTLCGMLGGDEIYAALSDELGVGMNETTADGRLTLEHAECLAACDYAPVVTVNYEFFDNQSVDSALELVGDLRAGQRPLPTRGAPLCSFKEISRQIAGFLDPRSDSIDATASGAPTTAGVRLADERDEHAEPYPTPVNGRANGSAPAGKTAATDQRATKSAGYGAPGPENSGNDAPLETAESDPANPAPPASQKDGD